MQSVPAFPTRPPRFPVVQRHAVSVCVQSTETGDSAVVPGELLDLSPGGAKVMLDSPFRFQQAVTLRLESPDLGLQLSMRARVCWIRPSGQQWRLGCSFDPLLPPEQVDRLLANGVLERRRDERETIDGAATATWELNPQATPVTVVDLSRGGFCLRAPLPAEPSSRLRLQAAARDGSLVQASATVQWRLAVPGGFLLGCSLAHPEACLDLRAALVPEPATHPLPRRRRFGWYAAAAAVCMGLIWMLYR
jgi:hypothetical protein